MPRISLKKSLFCFPFAAGVILFVKFIFYSETFILKHVTNEVIFESPEPPAQVDWADVQLIEKELARVGPGEQGLGVYLNSNETNNVMKLINVNGFNAIVSDRISFHRAINDLRTPTCKSLKYDKILPLASVIIPLHDEHWSTLLRTVHSVINRSPPSLLKELILVDDNSTKQFLHKDLDKYISDNFKKVRLLRTEKREGLIRARIIGAKSASGDILIFLDSHCEVGINWLPALLQPIKDNYKTVTCPFIDVINNDDFSLHPQDEGARGAFDWELNYKRIPHVPVDRNHPEQPFESPIMAGGLFAISRRWFWELSGYDEGLEVWGGEQYELSFKIWMCGGRMLDIPCCRIGHVYRKFNPFGVPGLGDYVAKNYKRIAEVWMDEWKTFVYKKSPQRYSAIGYVNVTKQKYLRKRLKCKSFRWFLEHVAYDLLEKYPPSEPEPVYNGKIISAVDPSLCIDSKFGKQGDPLSIDKCMTKRSNRKNGEQTFQITWRFEIRPTGRHVCFDFPGIGITLVLYNCHESGGNQKWIFNPNTRQIIHRNSHKCIDSKPQRLELYINDCNSNETQKWRMENIDKEIIQNEWRENSEKFQ